MDPALAARLLDATEHPLLDDTTHAPLRRSGTLLGALFESLAVMSGRVFAEAGGARVAHLRTRNGDHEIDLIIERDDHKVLAMEVKLSASVSRGDATHLR